MKVRTQVPRTTRRSLLLAAVAATALSACGGSGGPATTSGAAPSGSGPRPLTTDEASALAMVRFRQFEASPVPVTMSWPGSPAVTFAATLDLRKHFGYGTFTTEADGSTLDRGFVAWDLETLATAQVAGTPRKVPKTDLWYRRSMSTEIRRDIFLAVALNLGSDRPENPALLRQSSARFLRYDELDGDRVSVIEGPRPAGAEGSADGRGRLRYWLDDRQRFRKLEAYLGDQEGRFASLVVADPHRSASAIRPVARRILASGGDQAGSPASP